MAQSSSRKRNLEEDLVPEQSKRRVKSASKAKAKQPRKPYQSTLTQIQFVPQLSNESSDIDLEEQRLTTPRLQNSTSNASTKKKRASASANQNTTITQMDFLSSSFSMDLDEDDFKPLRVHKCSKKPETKESVRGGETIEPKDTIKRKKYVKDEEDEDYNAFKRQDVQASPSKRRQQPSRKSVQWKNATDLNSVSPGSKADNSKVTSSRTKPIPDSRVIPASQDSVSGDENSYGGEVLALPRTPITQRKHVIPSSQSPESLPPSTSKRFPSQYVPDSPKSPLKDRSPNVGTPSKRRTKDLTPWSGKKRVCERNKSKLVILPVALTSQGAVSKGTVLSRSQWPNFEDIPPKTPPRTIKKHERIVPSSQDDDLDIEASSDGLPSPTRIENNPNNLQMQQVTESQVVGPVEDDDDEPPFNLGTPIRAISPVVSQRNDSTPMPSSPPHQATKNNVPQSYSGTPTLSRSDSEAAAQQLRSDMFFHSTQTVATTATGSSPQQEMPDERPSQISTQGPTQPQSQRRPGFTNLPSSPDKVYIKLKNSSSIPISMDDIPRHSQFGKATQLQQVLDEDQSETNLMDTDDLNPPTYRQTNALVESSSLTPLAETHREPPLSSKPPRLMVRNSTFNTDSAFSSSPQTAEPQDTDTRRFQPSNRAFEGLPPSSQRHLQNEIFSSSPILKDVVWKVPESLMESLPGPPGWDHYDLEEEEMKRI